MWRLVLGKILLSFAMVIYSSFISDPQSDLNSQHVINEDPYLSVLVNNPKFSDIKFAVQVCTHQQLYHN
jgi:hypothetical protein